MDHARRNILKCVAASSVAAAGLPVESGTHDADGYCRLGRCLAYRLPSVLAEPTGMRTATLMIVTIQFLLLGTAWSRPVPAGAVDPEVRIRVDHGHAWRPPFGTDRIGRPLVVEVTIMTEHPSPPAYTLVALRDQREIHRAALHFSGESPFRCEAELPAWPTQLVITARNAQGLETVLARHDVTSDAFEAEAAVVPDDPRHPVDLGAILVPNDWLLLAGGQTGTIVGAVLCRNEAVSAVEIEAWFESVPDVTSRAELGLTADRRADFRLALPDVPRGPNRDVLQIRAQTAAGERLWEKAIPTMLVQQLPAWPAFGAVATKLRYDAPISVRADDGTYSALPYDQGWDPQLQDVVVMLPNGARFVFWRGSSYVPFWAGRCNTGLSYEWAETGPLPDGFVDCVEPLMDKELRYGRVQIVESTPARVHVRWSYQSCDFEYRVWGDSAVEDFYFYPDGFGTRVLTLQATPAADYELSEFIILTPQATYPLSVLPSNLVDVLFLDGEKRELSFPYFPGEQAAKVQSRDVPAIYRVRMHQDETLTAFYFNPREVQLPPAIFAPFFDGDQLVTPTYWGSHWPLARGKTTGSAIDDRVHFTPCHNSVMSWARQRPQPVRVAELETIDTLGRVQSMRVQTWVWLIGMGDADDAALLEWAHSFAQPPSLDVAGARLEASSYVPERRAMRLIVESDEVTISIKPSTVCVHPVFELCEAPATSLQVWLAGRRLPEMDYAWDGATLWIRATLREETLLQLVFEKTL